MTDALTVIEQPALPADLTATLELAADFAQNSKAPATRAAYERGSRSSFQRPFCGPVSQWPKRCLSGRQLERNHSMGIRGSRNNREYWWDPYRLLQFGGSRKRRYYLVLSWPPPVASKHRLDHLRAIFRPPSTSHFLPARALWLVFNTI